MQRFFKSAFHKEAFLFSLPIVLSMFAQQLYNIVDTMIVGRFLGINELAAVGNAGSIIMVFIVVSGGIELGSQILVSQYVGKNETAKIASGSVNFLFIGMSVAILLTILGIFGLPLFYKIIQLPDELITLTNIYAITYMAGIVFIYGYDISRSILTSLGYSKICFYFVLSSSLINIVLDLIFICILKMGVFGAALATILSQFVLMIFSFYYLYHQIKDYPEFSFFPHFDYSQIKELIHITIPSIFQQFVITCSFIFIQAMINPFGSETISGFVSVNKVLTLARIPIIGFSHAFSIYATQMIVKEENQKLKEIYCFFTKISFFYSFIISIFFLIFTPYFCLPFFDVREYPIAFNFFKTYLLCSIPMMFLCTIKFMNENLLRSHIFMKKFLISNFSDLFFKIGITYLIVSFSTHAFWMGEMVGKLVAVMISTYFLLQNKKKKNCFHNSFSIE